MESPAKARSGDEWIDAVVRTYERRLLRYALSLTRNLERARDAVQETLLDLTRSASTVDHERPSPWLFSVCRARCIDLTRRETRRAHRPDDELAHLASPDPPPDHAAETGEAAAEARRLLARLPEREQEAVRLKFQEGLRNVEIAQVLGITANHVGVLLHTALARLRREMAPATVTTLGVER